MRMATLVLLLICAFMLLLEARVTPATVSANATSDPCAGTALKLSVPLKGIADDLVPPVIGKTVYVCGFVMEGHTFFSEESSLGQCASGTDTALTGGIGSGSNVAPVVAGNNKQTIIVTASGSGLCVEAAQGTGFVTYVQQ